MILMWVRGLNMEQETLLQVIIKESMLKSMNKNKLEIKKSKNNKVEH